MLLGIGMGPALLAGAASDAGPLLFLDPLHNTCILQRLRNLDDALDCTSGSRRNLRLSSSLYFGSDDDVLAKVQSHRYEYEV